MNSHSDLCNPSELVCCIHLALEIDIIIQTLKVLYSCLNKRIFYIMNQFASILSLASGQICKDLIITL